MSAMEPRSAPSAQHLRRQFDDGFAEPASERRQDFEPFLTLRIASTAYAVRLSEIAGFAAARKIVPLTSRLPGMLGLAAVRGSLLPVYCLEALLHDEAAAEPRWFLLCRGQEPMALSFAQFEGHVLVPRSARLAAKGAEGRHVQELVQVDNEVRGIIAVSSLAEAIRESVAAQRPVKER